MLFDADAIVLAGGGSGGAVTSVNGQTGAVVLDNEDVGAVSKASPVVDSLIRKFDVPDSSVVFDTIFESFHNEEGVGPNQVRSAVSDKVNVASDIVGIGMYATSADGTLRAELNLNENGVSWQYQSAGVPYSIKFAVSEEITESISGAGS